MLKVHVVVPPGKKKMTDVHKMFKNRGYRPVLSILDADLVQFIGGADICPSLYGEHPHNSVIFDSERDRYELMVYRIANNAKIPMAGICRGGQLLNVLNGGKLYQDVEGHDINATHSAIDILSGEDVYVTSAHHQLMIPGEEGEILAYSRNRGKKRRVNEDMKEYVVNDINLVDVEALYYRDAKCLCFQPHPEWDYSETTDLYFNYLMHYFVNDGVPF